MLKLIRKTLLWTQRISLRYYKTTLLLTLISFMVALVGVDKLQFLLSIDDLIDSDFETYEHLMEINSKFKDKNTILLSIESKEVFSKPFLCELQSWILNTAQNRTDLIQIQTTFGIRQAKITKNQFEMRSFLDLDCLSDAPETEKIIEGFKKVQTSPWKGILSTNEDYSLTVNFIVYDPQDKKFGSIDINVVPELQKSFSSDFFNKQQNKEKYQIYWGGITTYQSYLRQAFDQTQLLNVLMFVISLIIFRYFLGSWKAGFIFNLTIIISMAITFGVMGFFSVPVDVLTNSTGLMMIVGCLEDFVFVVFGMLRYKWNMQKSLRRFMVASFFTSLTTAIGFGSLITSELSIIRRFGLISAFAAMLEWGMVYIFLPCLIKRFPSINRLKFTPPKFNFSFTQKNIIPRWLAIILCFPVIIPFIWTDKLVIKDSPASFFFDDHIVIKTTEHFKKTRGWITEISLVFNSENTEETNRQLIAEAKKIKFIEKIEDLYNVNDYLTQGLDSSDKAMVLSFWEESVFSKRLKSKEGVHRAQIFLNSMEMEDIKIIIDSFNDICKGNKCYIAGSLISYNEFSIKILRTLFSSLGLSIFLVILLLISVKKSLSWTDSLSLVVSSVWGPLILLSIFIILKIPLSFVSCICASLLEGLAGDNAIQFMLSSKKENLDDTVNDLSQASLIVTIGMMMLISVFMLSTIASLSVLGGYILLGLVLAFVGDIWMLKGLLGK